MRIARTVFEVLAMWKPNLLKFAMPALAAVVTVTCLSGPALAADAPPPGVPVPTQPAVWVQKEVQFTYMGFTTHFTCDGLREVVRGMLLQLGARKDDLKVYEQPCSRPDRPDPFPGVSIKMSVLQPAPGAPAPGADPSVVEAYWAPIKLPYHASNLDAAGECELLEQFKHTVLPLFTTRNVDLKATCIPHQLEPLGTSLQAEVLVTNQKSPKNAASPHSAGTPLAAR
jgi:hypothetical protein